MTAFPSSEATRPLDRLRAAWALGEAPDIGPLAAGLRGDDLADLVVADAVERWARHLPAGIEHYAAAVPGLGDDAEACRALLMLEFAHRDGEPHDRVLADLHRRFPGLAPEIDLVTELHRLASAPHAAGEPEAEESAAVPGSRIAKYRLDHLLGRGSFGEVWQAWDSELRRYVALKLIRTDDDPTAGEPMFLGEARAAAALDHENLVRVHAAGRAAEGLYYIDSQLAGDPAPSPQDPHAVRVGRSLDRVAATGDLLSPARVAGLVEQVARGVAAAHARGITHRDLKPANILVTDSGRALVADFGLSRRAPTARPGGDPVATTATLVTGSGRIVGTPGYMSPEQARGDAATPVSDIYSLGATLYYLLTRRHPFGPTGRYSADPRMDVVEQVRRGEEPDAAPLAGVPRTLAAICLKAMAFDPADRYVSADALAADLRNWLGSRPTAALPPGPAGRASLWIRRNAAIAAVSAGAAALVLGGTGYYLLSLQRERDRAVAAEVLAENRLVEAEAARDESLAVNEFLQDMLASADPQFALGRPVLVRDVVDTAAARLASGAGRPTVEAGVRTTLGVTYMSLGLYAEAEAQLLPALELRRAALGADDPATAATMHQVGALRISQGRYQDAQHVLRETLDLRRRILPDGHADAGATADLLGVACWRAGRNEEAESLLREAHRIRLAKFGEGHAAVAATRHNLGSVLLVQARYGEAEAMLTSALEARQRVHPPDHPDTLKTMLNLAALYQHVGRNEDAESLTHEILAGFRRVLGDDHALVAMTLHNRAVLLMSMSRHADAEPEIREAMRIQAKLVGENNADYASMMDKLASILLNQGRPEEAESLARRAVAIALDQLTPDHRYTGTFRTRLGQCLTELGRYEEAEEHLLVAHPVVAATFGANEAMTTWSMRCLRDLYEKWGRPDDAAAWRARLGPAGGR